MDKKLSMLMAGSLGLCAAAGISADNQLNLTGRRRRNTNRSKVGSATTSKNRRKGKIAKASRRRNR